jgi:hypothetical protein
MKTKTFLDYWTELDSAGKTALCARVRTSKDTMSQVAHGHRALKYQYQELIRIVTGVNLVFDKHNKE